MIQVYDHESQSFSTPSGLFQVQALAYDSAYEMGLFNSLANIIPFQLGLFHFTAMV